VFNTTIHNEDILLENSSIKVTVKREDLIHPFVSGNKYRKLKYNLQSASNKGHKLILTFGGAYSNHIAAVAAAGHIHGFKTIGIIRGEELALQKILNPTLKFTVDKGMHLKFVSREAYRTKAEPDFINALRDEFGDFYLIPEGGTNDLAVKGCEEILLSEDNKFDYICCAVGTGGTISGLINASKSSQTVLGFPALKGDFLQEDIRKFANQRNWKLVTDYHFGGYGKIKPELIAFINRFKSRYNISLDPVYTGKMMFGIFDLIDKGFFPDHSKILVIHTGGLQGIDGMNSKLKIKNLPLINE
jgi:1-aminocyclopropane-1-carboxylate deaminase